MAHGPGWLEQDASARRGMSEEVESHSRLDGRLSVGIAEAAGMLGVSYGTIERAVRDRSIASFKVRNRRLIPVEALRQILTDAESR
jgi:excisionase family DNA binding protein